jgi:conjugal transfer pilus assembly protein TraF
MHKIILILLFLLSIPTHANDQEAGKSAGDPNVVQTGVTTPTADANWWNQNIWSDPDRGFYWYPPNKPIEPKSKKQKTAEKPKPKSIYEMRTSEEVHKELNRLLDAAIFNPSPQNVYNYQKAKMYVLNLSEKFANETEKITWQNPDIDQNAQAPISNAGQNLYAVNQFRSREKVVNELSGHYGILFFFRSDCPYCHDEAPIIQGFNEKYGMDILGVSLDGPGLSDFAGSKPDNGISMMVSKGRGIQTVPAMYLVSKDDKTIVPLGAGFMTEQDLINRIAILTGMAK